MSADTASVSERSPERSSFDDIVGIRLRRLQQALNQHWAAWFGELGLEITPVQGGVLLAIDENPGLTQTALARFLQVETPTLSEVLRPLIGAGWVTKNRAENDARAVALCLSEAGKSVTAIVRANVGRHEQTLLAGLSPGERQTLIRLLDKSLPLSRQGSASERNDEGNGPGR